MRWVQKTLDDDTALLNVFKFPLDKKVITYAIINKTTSRMVISARIFFETVRVLAAISARAK